MSEEQKVEETEPQKPVTEEIKVQAEDLFKTINDLIRRGAATRITVTRKGRTLVDIPLVAGVAAGGALAIYMPVLSAIAAAGALLGGCTVHIQRDEPPAVS